MIEKFLSQVCVLDTETTHTDPLQAQIVELAVGHFEGSWSVRGQLFGLEGEMPPEASAKNQISQAMIKGKPTFGEEIETVATMIDLTKGYWVAHNAAYDRQVLVNSFRSADIEPLADLMDDSSRWICTWRLSKHAYHHQFSDQLYGQNYLRYRLNLPVDHSLGVHRAEPDVVVCASLLERLIDDLILQEKIDPQHPLGPQLVALTNSPISLTTWPFGKHRGTPIASLSTDYLLWAIDNVPGLTSSSPDIDLVETVRSELERRLA